MSASPKLDLEGAIMDAHGDALLMGLVIEVIGEAARDARVTGSIRDGRLLVMLDEDTLTALDHARNRLDDSMKTARDAFEVLVAAEVKTRAGG